MGDKQKVFSRNFQKMMNETFPILVRNVRIQRRSSSQDPPVRDPLGPQSERQEGIEVENGMWGCVWSTQRGRECSLVSLPPLQLQFKLTLASIRLQLRYDLSAQPPPPLPKMGKVCGIMRGRGQQTHVPLTGLTRRTCFSLTELSRTVPMKQVINNTPAEMGYNCTKGVTI